MTAIVVAAAQVVAFAIASHAFHSYLKLRERECISKTDRTEIEAQLAELKRTQNELKNVVANLPRR